MLDQLKLLLRRSPRVSSHPILGELHYKRHLPAWQGKFLQRNKNLFLSVGGNKQQPDEKLTDLAVIVADRLAEFEELALSYQSTLPRSFAPERLELTGFEAFYPPKAWISQTLTRHNPRALEVVKPSEPMFALVFSITDDRNVLDVIFARETPVDADYH